MRSWFIYRKRGTEKFPALFILPTVIWAQDNKVLSFWWLLWTFAVEFGKRE